ncbi:hypothetical protein GOBAR_DD28941 [Gossypium barbadense]|nr:hypothetical protein GOBAR_DD28941 [Gossypium barbadense]
MGASEDDEYARIMSSCISLSQGNNYSSSTAKNQLKRCPINISIKIYLTNQFTSTGLTEEPVTKGEISHGRIIHQDTKTLSPSINASAPFEKKSVQASKSEFDSSKAFTGSIVEHTQNLDKRSVGANTTSLQSSGSQPWKPVCRFKMQRK